MPVQYCSYMSHTWSYLLKKHPWTPTKMLQLAMNSKCLKPVVHSHYAYTAAFLLGFHHRYYTCSIYDFTQKIGRGLPPKLLCNHRYYSIYMYVCKAHHTLCNMLHATNCNKAVTKLKQSCNTLVSTSLQFVACNMLHSVWWA